MSRGAKDFIAANFHGISRLEGYIVDASGERAVELSFSGNTIMVNVDVAIYERGRTGDGMLIGSPTESRGIGRGEIGVSYGDPTEVVSERTGGVFTVLGRQSVVDSLRGEATGLHQLVAGSGDAIARTSDESLDEPQATYDPWGVDATSNVVTVTRTIAPNQTPGLSEVGMTNRRGELMCRLLFDLDWQLDTDYRAELTFSFESEATGDAVITDEGLTAIASSVTSSEEVIGINRAVIGTADDLPDPSDTDLANRLDSKTVQREARSESVTALTMWFEDEPAGHPHTLQEVGLEDSEGRFLWRTIFEPVEKTDDLPVLLGANIRII